MDTVPTSVIECALLDGAPPQLGDGGAWCDAHNKCDHCAQDVVDAARDELRHLKAERDRALAELDKALGEREEHGCIHYDPKRHYCDVHDCETDDYKRGYDEGFASADDWYAEHAVELAEHGWVQLPKDADGEYIRIGDVMEWRDSGETLEVVGIGDDCLFYMDGEEAEWTAARNKRHHHAPTVEDVLTEFADQYAFYKEVEKGVCPDLESHKEVLRQFAAKLRLANE